MTSPNNDENDIVYRLRKRAEIRRQISTRKSVQENQPDRISDLLEEAANEIEKLCGPVPKFANIEEFIKYYREKYYRENA